VYALRGAPHERHRFSPAAGQPVPAPRLSSTTVLAVTAGWLICSCWAAATAAEPLVGGYYYPWYYPDRWIREPVTHTPRLGWYSSDDRDVATQHVRWAKEAGLDFLLVSWLTATGHEGKNLDAAVLPALDAEGLRFAILYETPLALGLPAGKPIDFAARLPDGKVTGDRFVEHFDLLADRYLAHPRYLRLAGRPVVVVYLVRDMVNAAPALAQVRERLGARGIDLHLIADAVYWAPVETWDWKLLADHFQAVTAYNMYYRPDFLAAVEKQFAAAEATARGRGLRLVPSVMPGYDDTPLRGVDRVTINRRRGAFYRESWKVAERFVGPDQPLLLVTSFNEWHEGTELEPSTEFGDAYLRLTRELVDGLRKR
jgi:hypothetical protein